MGAPFPGGEGIFETIKTWKGSPFALDRHINRATLSAKKLSLPMLSDQEINEAIKIHLTSHPVSTEFGRLRVTFFTSGQMQLLHESYRNWKQPAKLTMTVQSLDEGGVLAGIKALPYGENLEILESARSLGFDDGIRLNSKGEVCETSVANLLFRLDGRWITPDLSSGCLPGIMRELALEWFDIHEGQMKVSDLARVEAIFLLSSLKDFQPVSVLDHHELEIDTYFLEKVRARVSQAWVG